MTDWRTPDAELTQEERDERYNHAAGSFGATVDAYEIPGEPEASIIVRRICRERSVWPDLLASGSRGSRQGYVVIARRLIWRGLYALTDLSIENIAELFGYSPTTVRPWARSWRPFEESEGRVWWSYWGLALADLVGVPLEEEPA